jgi:fatty acid desaturase
MHDCIHATLLDSTSAHHVLGTILGMLSGVEFDAFARLHWQHHRFVGQPDDPQGPDYLVGSSTSPTGLLVHLLRPLVGWNIFKLSQVFAALKRNNLANLSRRFFRLALVVGTQSLLAVIVSDGLRYPWLAPLPILSAATFGLFFAQLRGFAEHVAMPGVRQEGFVRSHRTTVFERLFLCDLNFNFHCEHHLCPSVPSRELPQLHRRLLAAGAVDALAPGMLRTVWQRIAAARTTCVPPKAINA